MIYNRKKRFGKFNIENPFKIGIKMDEQISNRIRAIMEQTQMKAADFCASIGITRSNLAHILSGRNQPSFAMLEKILKAYPQIKAEWLITGIGEMLRDEADLAETVENLQPTPPQYTQFEMQFDDLEEASPTPVALPSDAEIAPKSEVSPELVVAPEWVEPEVDSELAAPESEISEVESVMPGKSEMASVSAPSRPVLRPKSTPKTRVQRNEPRQAVKKVKKIVYFYDDHSFEEFYPED